MIGRFLEWWIVDVLARIFPSRWRVIPRVEDGAPLLRQFRIFETRESERGRPNPWHVGVYLQSPIRGERGWYHVHRWRHMISFVLSGWFWENRALFPVPILHSAPSVYQMDDTTVHRLNLASPRCWTLFIMIGRARHSWCDGWGYIKADVECYESWRAHVRRRSIWGSP